MEDIRSNSTNQKSHGGSPTEEVIRKYYQPESKRSKSRECGLEDSQKISYKLMAKRLFYSQHDFKLIQEAIINLQKPAKKRSKSFNARQVSNGELISQRRLVDSLEKVSQNKGQS
jgi:hypothetical protein